MPDAMQTPMVDAQLNYDGGAYAFSGKILTVHDLERSILTHVLPDRPVEVWLSPRQSVAGCCGLGGMLAGVIHSSRAVQMAEKKMMADGLKEQERAKARFDARGARHNTYEPPAEEAQGGKKGRSPRRRRSSSS